MAETKLAPRDDCSHESVCAWNDEARYERLVECQVCKKKIAFPFCTLEGNTEQIAGLIEITFGPRWADWFRAHEARMIRRE